MSKNNFFKTITAGALIAGGAYLLYKNRDKVKEKIKELNEELQDMRDDYEIVDEALNKLEELEDRVEKNLSKFGSSFDESLEKVNKEIEKIEKQVRSEIKEKSADVQKDFEDTAKHVRKAVNDSFKLNQRQEMIYKLIKEEGEAAMADISDLIAGVTNRTLRRDMTKLEKLGLVEQIGKTKSSSYKLKA